MGWCSRGPPSLTEYRSCSIRLRASSHGTDRIAIPPRNFTDYGESPVRKKLDLRELAAYTGIASLILNLDETMTKQ